MIFFLLSLIKHKEEFLLSFSSFFEIKKHEKKNIQKKKKNENYFLKMGFHLY